MLQFEICTIWICAFFLYYYIDLQTLLRDWHISIRTNHWQVMRLCVCRGWPLGYISTYPSGVWLFMESFCLSCKDFLSVVYIALDRISISVQHVTWAPWVSIRGYNLRSVELQEVYQPCRRWLVGDVAKSTQPTKVVCPLESNTIQRRFVGTKQNLIRWANLTTFKRSLLLLPFTIH